jgi:hypothetical protein
MKRKTAASISPIGSHRVYPKIYTLIITVPFSSQISDPTLHFMTYTIRTVVKGELKGPTDILFMTFLKSAARESGILLFSIINSDATRQALDEMVILASKSCDEIL